MLTLSNLPYIYQKIVNREYLEIRKVKIKKYLLLYTIHNNKVVIHRVLPEKFDYLNHLEKYKILIRK